MSPKQFSTLMLVICLIAPACFSPVYSLNLKGKESNQTPALPACKDTLSSETCAKIGQMLIVGFGGLAQNEKGKILWEDPNHLVFNKNSNIAHHIKHLHIGGVILFTRPFRHEKNASFIRDRNIQNPEQTQQLTKDLQQYSEDTRQEAKLEALPLFISIDQEGGMINRLPSDLGFTQTSMIPQAFGANEEKASDKKTKEQAKEQTRKYAEDMANELKTLNFNVNFAPCVDVNINPLNYVLGGRGRCISANPDIVANQAWQFVQAFQAKGIIAVLKHFPGHGSSQNDTHEGMVDVTETYQKEKELLPYKKLIKQGFQDIVMTTHVINGKIDKTQCKSGEVNDPKTWCPGTLSHTTLTKLLRETLGFKGVVISDDMTMGAIADEYSLEVAFEKAINAGVDMFILANNTADETEQAINTIAKLVKEEKISEAQIEAAYQRIRNLKLRVGSPRIGPVRIGAEI